MMELLMACLVVSVCVGDVILVKILEAIEHLGDL